MIYEIDCCKILKNSFKVTDILSLFVHCLINFQKNCIIFLDFSKKIISDWYFLLFEKQCVGGRKIQSSQKKLILWDDGHV